MGVIGGMGSHWKRCDENCQSHNSQLDSLESLESNQTMHSRTHFLFQVSEEMDIFQSVFSISWVLVNYAYKMFTRSLYACALLTRNWPIIAPARKLIRHMKKKHFVQSQFCSHTAFSNRGLTSCCGEATFENIDSCCFQKKPACGQRQKRQRSLLWIVIVSYVASFHRSSKFEEIGCG